MIRPINAENLKKNILKTLEEIGPTYTDEEFKKILIGCIDQEPMCDLSDMQNIIDFYKSK